MSGSVKNGIWTRIKEKLIRFFALDNFYYERIILTKEFLEQAISYAIESHPYECFGMLHGKVRNKILRITGILFVPHSSERGSVVTRPDPYNPVKEWGTVHSHPSGTADASRADLKTFSSNPINIIICYPYSPADIAMYDSSGKRLEFEIEHNH